MAIKYTTYLGFFGAFFCISECTGNSTLNYNKVVEFNGSHIIAYGIGEQDE